MHRYALFAAAFAVASPATANEFAPAMKDFYANYVAGWSTDAIILEALRTQNAVTADYSQAKIDEMDQAWRGEIGAWDTPTIEPVISNAAANFLREQVEASGGRMTEVILMDAVGLNAAVSHITSDMWQGDEAKYQETYLAGPDALHLSDVEKDESSGAYQAQISFPVVDPSSGELLGAITVGVDANSLL